AYWATLQDLGAEWDAAGRPADPDGRGRQIATALAELAGPRGLYARLSTVMAPGTSGGGGRVSGSKNAPKPVR
ncbi:hypothetical protein KBZ21_50480, partial [Streptomyces sp. A73]|nr:hypothetical protein [Streptomyces sp. A73]